MTHAGRTFLVPEVMQSSLTDCGPAALKAVLEGFGVDMHYDELRARCATDVDGTSISALSRLGEELGLDSREVLVSRDSFLLPEARSLPAIVVTRTGGGQLHFIVVWRKVGPWVQIMDPTSGRRWRRADRFLEALHVVPIEISQQHFRRWIGSANAVEPLRARMRQLGVDTRSASALLARTQADHSHHSFAALDAALRMVRFLVATKALATGAAATRFLRSVVDQAAHEPAVIPKIFWWASASRAPDKVSLRGSVIVHFELRRDTRSDAQHPSPAPPTVAAELPASALRALASARLHPPAVLFHILWSHARTTLCWIVIALAASALLMPVESILLRSILSAQRYLVLDYQRAAGVAAVLILMVLSLWIELWAATAVDRISRVLENHVRTALLEKLPSLDDAYIRTRPTSDMSGRGHALHLLRTIPGHWARSLHGFFIASAAAFGLLWVFPTGVVFVVPAALLALALPMLARRSLDETSTRLRTHTTALDVFYLDALIGVTPIRVHGAELAVRRQHEALLVEWGDTARTLHQQSTGVQALQLLVSTAVTLTLVLSYATSAREIVGILLLAYWALRMQAGAGEFATAQLALRSLKSVALRLLTPLAAPVVEVPPQLRSASVCDAHAAHIQLENVSVLSGGHVILRDVNIDIPAGHHVALVGASGAGKSSLISVLLGFAQVSAGSVRLDGQHCDTKQLRRETAWIDPAVRIWDRTLYDNLTYAQRSGAHGSLSELLADADLLDVLERLPEGMQTQVGEGGVRLSGGQGQRVRIGRALAQQRARLVLLDEPFRGLPHADRTLLLQRLRARFRATTLLFVSHDVSATLDFDRVLVMERGEIVEDAPPTLLASQPGSRYARLLEAEQRQRTQLWAADRWQRRELAAGCWTESSDP